MKKAIIRINTRLPAEEMQAISDRVRRQWEETGLIVLGPWCDVYVVDDAEIVGGDS